MRSAVATLAIRRHDEARCLVWLGSANAADHQFWAWLPDARPFVVTENRRRLAAGYARARRTGRGRWINWLVPEPEADPIAVLLATFHGAAEGCRIGACVPGPSPPLAPMLAAGCQIIDRDTFMASDPSLFDATRRISDGGIA